MNTNLPYYLGFSHFLGIGPIKFNALLKFYEVKEAYNLPEIELARIVGPNTAKKFINFRTKFNPLERFRMIESKKIEVLTREDLRYPIEIKSLSDAPICLYTKGDIEQLNSENRFKFGVVGTRNATAYGLNTTRKIIEEIYRRNFESSVVSGLAYGIDAVAHEAAIENGGVTIAFLGCGVDIVYPYGNKRLYEKIILRGGAVISEFPPGQTVVPGLFIARNRLISGLSRGVLVVEGAKTSGSMITARYAAEQGKDVFALPGQINNKTAESPNILIKEGAIIVTSTSDICDYYGFGVGLPKKDGISLELSAEGLKLYKYLDSSPKLVDDIVNELNIPTHKVLMLLSNLEIEGVIERQLDERYISKAIHRV